MVDSDLDRRTNKSLSLLESVQAVPANIDVYSVRTIACKYCGRTESVVKFGTYNGEQRYWCKSCRRKFADNQALPGKHFPTAYVGAALAMFYRGLSTKEIGQQIGQQYDILPPSKSTIYRWVAEYTPIALRQAQGLQPSKLGDTWVADETYLKVKGRTFYLWDVMDAKTRYLLASHLSPNRGIRDAEVTFRQAYRAAGKAPKHIVTDRLAAYIDGIERVFGADTRHVQSGGMRAEINNNLSERLQGSVKQRYKTMRGLQTRETAQLVLDGWALNYNLFRPHEALKNRTPATAAGVLSPFDDWDTVARRGIPEDATFRPAILSDRQILRNRGLRVRPLTNRRRW